MGAGRSQEAAFELRADLPRGTWTLVGDGIILESVDVRFEVFVRRGEQELPVVSWDHRFDPRPSGFDAVPFEEPAQGAAIDRRDGDLLVFRYTGQSAVSMNAYVPNGDGFRQKGRIPHLRLPK